MKAITILQAVILSFAFRAAAGDRFPVFSEAPFQLTLSTQMRGYEPTPQDEAGTNAVYKITGQIFTNGTGEPLQTTTEGFSGVTDKHTPWKTLTELLAVYQQGYDQKKVRALYTDSSQEYFDKMFTNQAAAAQMKEYYSSVTGMQALLGFEFAGGYVAFVNESSPAAAKHPMPYYLVKTNGVYRLSTFDNDSKMLINLWVFFATHTAAELIR